MPDELNVLNDYHDDKIQQIKSAEENLGCNLIDVTDIAKTQFGYRLPVAITPAAYKDCVEWTNQDSVRQIPQTSYHRLCNVLSKTRCAIAEQAELCGVDLSYYFLRVPRDGKSQLAMPTRLKISVGPANDHRPKLIIMLHKESFY